MKCIMNKPLLTIAIPTWNRSGFLKRNLIQLRKEYYTVDTDLVELLVSDNCSTDDTTQVVKDSIDKGLPISYYKNESNLGWGANFLACFKKARGKYVLLLSDDDLIIDGGLLKIMNVLFNNENCGTITLNSYGFDTDFKDEMPKLKNKPGKKYEIFDEYLYATCLDNTLLSASVVNTELIQLDEKVPEIEKNLAHLKYILTASKNAETNYFINDYVIAVKRDNSSSYKYTQVFVNELWSIYDAVLSNDLSDSVLRKIKIKYLLSFYPRNLLTIDDYLSETKVEILTNFDKHYFNIRIYALMFRPILNSANIIKKVLLVFLTIYGKLLIGKFGRMFCVGMFRIKKSILK
jgi:abequosyltransferase